MTTDATTDTRLEQAQAELRAAKAELFAAETALHDARLTYVDAWIMAAYDHLHRACLGLSSAESRWEQARKSA